MEAAGVESSASLEFTYTQLAQVTGLDRRTVTKAIRCLSAAGWLTVTRGSHRRPVRCQLKDPRLAGSETELQKAKRRLQKATFAGEAIMREFLTLLVDSEEYEDDAAPGFLVNPLTGERLQLDRYYPPSVAFEFNGPQHYGPTELYSAEEAEKQRARDLIKMGLCAQRGIHLVIVHTEDLSLSGMKQKIGNLLYQSGISPTKVPASRTCKPWPEGIAGERSAAPSPRPRNRESSSRSRCASSRGRAKTSRARQPELEERQGLLETQAG